MLEKQIDNFFQSIPDVLDWGAKKIPHLTPHRHSLQDWVEQGFHGQMDFMSATLKQRMNLSHYAPWAKSIVIYLLEYPVGMQCSRADNEYAVSRYAKGLDYHFRAKQIFVEWHNFISNSSIKSEMFSDAKPIFERDWASEMGLGWRAKNTFTLNQNYGSDFFLAGFLLSESVEKIRLVKNLCGSCRRCLDACPTEAFLSPGKIDATRCLSYWTIEAKGEIPLEIEEQWGSWIFGCDVCQEVCPWVQKSTRYRKTKKGDILFSLSAKEWLAILRKKGGFRSYTKGTPLQRAGRKKMLRNLAVAMRYQKDTSCFAMLQEILNEEEDWVKSEIKKTILSLESIA